MLGSAAGLLTVEDDPNRPSPATCAETHPAPLPQSWCSSLRWSFSRRWGMRRREFLGVLGGAVAAWPLAARAQRRAMLVVGFLEPALDRRQHWLAAFRRG